jgi:hypothetical protein
MARKSRQAAPARRGVTLPLAPWEEAPGLARPILERGEGPPEVALDRDGAPVVRRAPVWRSPVSPVMRALPEAPRAALLDYANLVEKVASSGGTLDPSGAGGGRSAGPSLGRLIAARHLADLDTLLAARRFVAVVSGGGATVTTYRDLARWVAVDGASRRELEARMGLPRTDAWRARLTRAIGEAAHLLAVRLGYGERDAS